MAAAIRSRYVMAGTVRTHYSEAGDDGPVIVALHGGGAGSSGEAGFGRIMPLLAPHYRVIALDSVGGYGDTDVQAPVPYGIQSRLDHLEGFVEALALDRFAIMGNSQGAWVAAAYAILHPDRVTKMALVASATIAGALGIRAPQTEGMRILQGYDGTREAMRRLLQALIVDQKRITDDLIDTRQAAASRPGAAEARKAFTDGTRRFTTDPVLAAKYGIMKTALPALTKVIPTICLWGEQDNFAPPELGRELSKLLPDVPFHWVPAAGHQAQNDQPEAVTRVLLEFLAAPAKQATGIAAG